MFEQIKPEKTRKFKKFQKFFLQCCTNGCDIAYNGGK